MTELGQRQPLKFMHPTEALNVTKLKLLSERPTETPIHSLQPASSGL
jgi:hypothetical protein